jgi:hypothetical protein
MIKFLFEGGPVFTVPMSILLLISLVFMARTFAFSKSGDTQKLTQAGKEVSWIKYLGILSLGLGLLGQLIGLYDAFKFIEQAGSISPALLVGGIRVSSITTIYGLVIFILCYGSWGLLNFRLTKAGTKSPA